MKILHTSDWHIGHRLHENSQFEEQTLFFEWLLNTIEEERVDVLIVAGDIFDTASPSSQSRTMYYNLLVEISKSCCKYVVLTGGNHDSPGMLNAPKEILKVLNTKIVAKATENIEDEVFEFEIGGEHIIVAAVPYLRDQDIRRAISADTSFSDIEMKYKVALKKHYNEIAKYCKAIKQENSTVVAMGHLFAVGGTVSESEKDIYIGGLGHINAEDFSDVFDYVALGHLHRPQLVGNKKNIRYSGSPLVYSFSEVQSLKSKSNKMIYCLEVEDGKIKEIKDLEIPQFRVLKSYKGTVKHCLKKIKRLKNNKYNLVPWVAVELIDEENVGISNTEINNVAEENGIEILKISIANSSENNYSDELLNKDIKQLKPIDVFKMKCKENNIDLEERKDLLDAFYEALNIAKEM